MKEHNYTIPLTEALEAGPSCFLCKIEDELTERAMDYYMGAAVMEPGVRIETNAKGFCRTHGEIMREMPKKLPLMLALETRLLVQKKELEKAKMPGKAPVTTCAVCERVAGQMDKCIENCVWLLQKEPLFLEMYLASEGVCLHHFGKISSKMGRGDKALYQKLHQHMTEKLERLHGEIQSFTKSFDYRFTPEAGIDQVPRKAVETLTGRKG